MMKIKLPKIWTDLTKDKNQRMMIGGFVILGLVFVLGQIFTSTSSKAEALPTEMESPDTVIPKGFVLVPLELQNAEALGAIIDQFAIVDLYSTNVRRTGNFSGGGVQLGHHLRLLRAPQNPHTFAVLVPESQAARIVNHQGPVIAVIQNRAEQTQGQLVSEKKTIAPSNKIQYYSEDKE